MALGLGLVGGALDVLFQVAEVARVDSGLGLVKELLDVALLDRVGILLNKLLDLGALVEHGLG